MTALAFLHGFGGSARTWDFIRARLGGTATFAPTLRGFAGEDDVAPGWNLGHATDDALARLAAAGLPGGAPFVLVGHSMGGKLALAVAMRRPPGLRALVLLAPSPPGVEPIDPGDRAEALRSHGDRAYVERNADKVACHWPGDRRAQCVDDTLAVGPRAWAWWYGDGSREALDLTAADLPPHVAVAVGDHDTTISPATERRFVARFASASLTVVAGAAHQLPLEADAPCAGLIVATLDRLSRRRGARPPAAARRAAPRR